MPTTITISEFQPDPGHCNFTGTTAKLRRYYNQDWTDVDGVFHAEGRQNSSTDFFDEIVCTLSGNTITVPAFSTTPTDNPQTGSNVQETWQLWDQAGSPRNVIFEGFIPSANPTITFGALKLLNVGQTLFESDKITRLDQWIQQYINTIIGVLRFATSVIAGWVRLSWPAANSVDPIAVSDSDPRVNLVINVKYAPYNAVGNGTADDTAALNLAFAQPGRIVVVPKGSYKVTANLASPVCASIVGAGKDLTIFVPTTAVTSFMKLSNLTPVLQGFTVDGIATTGAVGLTFGDIGTVGDFSGGLVVSLRIKNFKGVGGTGIRLGDIIKSVFIQCAIERNNINMFVQGISSDAYPTTVTFQNCQFTDAETKGVKIISGHTLNFTDGCAFDSNGQEAVIIGPSSTVEDILIDGVSLEANYGADATHYQIKLDGSMGTGRVAIRNAAIASGGAKSIHITGASAAGFILDNVQVPETAATILIENGAFGSIVWPRNRVYTNCVLDTARTGTTPTAGAESSSAASVAYTPVFSSDIGTAADTFTGAVTITKARFFLIGRRLFIEITWSATLKAVTPAFINITLPTGLLSESNNVWKDVRVLNNATWEAGQLRTDGGNLLQQYRQQLGVYTSGSAVAGRMSVTIDLQ